MRGVRRAGFRIPHTFGVAVVRGDQQRPPGGADGRGDAPEIGVHRLDRGDGGGEVAGVAHHVGVGEIDRGEVDPAAPQRRLQPARYRRRRHRRREVVGRDLRRRRQQPRLAGERLLAAAVEEERDVSVFLGFGGPELPQTRRRREGAEGVARLDGREQGFHPRIQRRGIARHSHRRGEGGRAGAGERREVRLEQRGEDLARAVGAEIGHDEAVAVLHAVIAADDRRRDEFVARARCVTGGDGRVGGRRARALAARHRRPGARRALPIAVAVHREIASAHGRERHARRARARSGLEGGEIAPGAPRRRIPPVEKGVDGDGNAGPGNALRQRQHVRRVGMNAARRGQARQMAPAAAAA